MEIQAECSSLDERTASRVAFSTSGKTSLADDLHGRGKQSVALAVGPNILCFGLP